MSQNIVAKLIGAILIIGLANNLAAQEGSHKPTATNKKSSDRNEFSVSGEIVDLKCYISAGEKGQIHSACAAQCINSGTPAGILDNDGTIYIIVGNKSEFARHAAQTVTVKGEKSTRDGLTLIKNATIVSSKSSGKREESHNHEGSHK